VDRVTLYFKEAARIAEELERDAPVGPDEMSGIDRSARTAIVQARARAAVEAQLGKLKRIRWRGRR
jgi:hypothetical protein